MILQCNDKETPETILHSRNIAFWKLRSPTVDIIPPDKRRTKEQEINTLFCRRVYIHTEHYTTCLELKIICNGLGIGHLTVN